MNVFYIALYISCFRLMFLFLNEVSSNQKCIERLPTALVFCFYLLGDNTIDPLMDMFFFEWPFF